jgi:DNA-binding NtrC family response regulator
VGSILLVESDPDTRDRLGSAMRDAGHEVLNAVTSRETFLRVSEGGIDAIVIDSYDPRAGVIELAQQFDALPDAPPVVLVSASPHAPEISARMGAAAFLPKPCDPQDLVQLLTRLVGEVRPVRHIEQSAPVSALDDLVPPTDGEFPRDDDPTGPVRISSLS